MSAVVKRSFDAMDADVVAPGSPSPLKRCRYNVPMATSPVSNHQYGAGACAMAATATAPSSSSRDASPELLHKTRQRYPLPSTDTCFVPHSSADPFEKYMAQAQHTKRRRTAKENAGYRSAMTDDGSACGAAAAAAAAEQPVLFTLEQVRSIVAHAVEDREQALRAEYEQTLHTKLTQQFHAFVKFNEDHIHRQLRESQHDYMS